MLTSGSFWFGVLIGAAGFYAYTRYQSQGAQ
jgi:hypothetical protein